jgi:hypothetical protein
MAHYTQLETGSGVLGLMPPPARARRTGVLGRLSTVRAYPDGAYHDGALGVPPVSGAYRSGALGVPPVSGAYRSGALGVPPVSGAVRSGSLGSLGIGLLGSLGSPAPAPAFRSGSLGSLGIGSLGSLGSPAPAPAFRSGSLGDAPLSAPKPAVATAVVALAGLGALGVIWWAMTRRHA